MMPAPRVQAAKGVLLRDIVEGADIDLGSVQRFHFVASDNHETSGDMSAKSILHTKRYFYPKLIDRWDDKTNRPGVGADEGREEVETMIAVESYTAERWDPEVPWDKMDSDMCYRLVFGMPSVDTVGGMHDSVKWVTAIEVQLAGSPPKDWGKNDEGDVVGSNPSNKDKGEGEGEDGSNEKGDSDGKTPDEETAKPPEPEPPKENSKPVYTVTYHANGGVGQIPAPKAYEAGSVAVAWNASSIAKEGYVFAGWSGNMNAARPQYRAGDTIIVNSNVNLDAIWQKETVGSGTADENTGKAGPKSGYGQNPGVASDGKSEADFGGGQNPSITGGITTVANPGVSGAELLAAGDLSEVSLKPGGLTDENNPWMVYEVSPESEQLKLPEPVDGTMPVAAGLLGGAFAVGGLYSFTSLSAKSLWALRRIFFIK
jgi:hypothetical protein